MIFDEVHATVITLICQETDPAKLSDEVLLHHRLRGDLGLDSLNIVALTVALEDQFEMFFDPINMDLVEIFESVGSLIAFIHQELEMRSVSNNSLLN